MVPGALLPVNAHQKPSTHLAPVPQSWRQNKNFPQGSKAFLAGHMLTDDLLRGQDSALLKGTYLIKKKKIQQILPGQLQFLEPGMTSD